MAAHVPTRRSERRIPKILAAELSRPDEPVPKDKDGHGEREFAGRSRHDGAVLATWNSRARYFSPKRHSVSRKDRLLPARGKWQLRPRARVAVEVQRWQMLS
jgi:hypothetical protein